MAPRLYEQFMKEYKYSKIAEKVPDRDKYPLYYQASAHEYTIEEGEMIFIPAGWFHVVYSEDVNSESQINFALNYWYDPVNNWKDGDPSCLLPYKKKHSIPKLDLHTIFGNDTVRVMKSELDGLFPSDRVYHKFPPGKCSIEFMKYDEFYTSKNPKYYIIQEQSNKFADYMPPYETPSKIMAAWINFGNARCLIHYDEYDNWLCQIDGKKRLILFPPEDRDLLYMFNPAPYEVITTIKNIEAAPTYYIAKTHFDLTKNIRDVYAEELARYKHIKLDHVQGVKFFPDIVPEKFTEITINGHYEKLQPYALSFIFAVEGQGAIIFHGRQKTLGLAKGELIMFPSHFTFPYELTGINLKIIVPM